MPRALFSIADFDGIRATNEKLDELIVSLMNSNRFIIRDDKIDAVKQREASARMALLKAVQQFELLVRLVD